MAINQKDIYIAERRSGMTVAEIAKKHGVALCTVYNATSCFANPRQNDTPAVLNEDMLRKDCIMYRDIDGKRFCSGLDGLYCSIEDCKFYKQKQKKEKQQ